MGKKIKPVYLKFSRLVDPVDGSGRARYVEYFAGTSKIAIKEDIERGFRPDEGICFYAEVQSSEIEGFRRYEEAREMVRKGLADSWWIGQTKDWPIKDKSHRPSSRQVA